MTSEPDSSEPGQEAGSVHTGDVSGGIHGSILAGRDVFINRGEAPALFSGVPAMPPHSLAGRDELIDEITGRLTSGHSLALSAEGLPGVGKTALAVALAHHKQVLAHFKDGVLWAGLGPQPDPISAQAAWAAALGVDISHLLEALDRRAALKNAAGARRLLIVIDDAWNLEAALALQCGGPNCCHLLTTRDKSLARDFAGLGGLHLVPTLEEDPAFGLLQELAPEACAVDPEAARSLARAVGGLPLALELLGGYLARPERSLFPDLSRQALAELADPGRRLQLACRRLGGRGRQLSLRETIDLSLDGLAELGELGEEARRAFHALGAFAPKPERFSRAAAEAVTGSGPAILALLDGRNLLEVSGDGLALHQTLAGVARSRPDEAAVARHHAFYLALVEEDRQDWRRIQAAYGQIKEAWDRLAEEEVLDWVWALRIYQERQGLWPDFLAWAGRALALAQAKGWPQAEGTLLNNIGGIYRSLGQPDKALDYFNRALPIREEVGDRAGQAQTLNNIGAVYNSLGQRDQALDFYNRALPIREEVGDRAGQATTLNNIGGVYHHLGQRDKALDYYNRALPISEEVGDRAGLANTLNNIGTVYDSLGQPDQALDFYNRALPIREEVGDRAGQAATRYNMAMIYRAQGRLAEAVIELRHGVDLDRQVQHPDLDQDMALLARVEAELSAQQKNKTTE